MHCVQSERLPYLRAVDVQETINKTKPSLLSQSGRVFTKTLVGFIGGELIGRMISIGLNYSCKNNVLNGSVEHFVKILIPSLSSLDFLPIKVAGLGGMLVFAFTFYREYHLQERVIAAERILGANPHRIIMHSEAINIVNTLPSNMTIPTWNFSVIEDKEIDSLIEQNNTQKLLNNALQMVLTTEPDEQIKILQIYKDIKKVTDDITLISHFFKNAGNFTSDNCDHLHRFFKINNIPLPKLPKRENGKTLFKDQEIEKFIMQMKTVKLLDDAFESILKTKLDDPEGMKQIYQNIKWNDNDKNLIHHFFTKAWGFTQDDTEHLHKFFEINSIKMPPLRISDTGKILFFDL